MFTSVVWGFVLLSLMWRWLSSRQPTTSLRTSHIPGHSLLMRIEWWLHHWKTSCGASFVCFKSDVYRIDRKGENANNHHSRHIQVSHTLWSVGEVVMVHAVRWPPHLVSPRAMMAVLCWRHWKSQKTWLSQCSWGSQGVRGICAAGRWCSHYPSAWLRGRLRKVCMYGMCEERAVVDILDAQKKGCAVAREGMIGTPTGLYLGTRSESVKKQILFIPIPNTASEPLPLPLLCPRIVFSPLQTSFALFCCKRSSIFLL